MFTKNNHANMRSSEGYRAELTSRMTNVRKPVSRQQIPAYAQIAKQESRSDHHCGECDKLYYEIERLQLQLEDKSSRGTRLAMADSRESDRSEQYRPWRNENWKASWAATPDLISTHSKRDGPQQKRQSKDLDEEIKRLKRELHQRTIEVRALREEKSRSTARARGTVVPSNMEVILDPLPIDRVSTLYTEVYDTDWKAANQVLLNDKINQEQAASKLIGILTDAFAYCEKISPDHLKTIIKTTLEVKPQTNINIPGGNNIDTDIQKEVGIFRKSVAEKTAMSIIKNFRIEVFMKSKGFTSKQKQNFDITKYVDKCVNITWFMAVQNFPIILDDSVTSDKTFNFETYDVFDGNDDSSEAIYDYLIWPALINAEDNLYLSKGIAQRKV